MKSSIAILFVISLVFVTASAGECDQRNEQTTFTLQETEILRLLYPDMDLSTKRTGIRASKDQRDLYLWGILVKKWPLKNAWIVITQLYEKEDDAHRDTCGMWHADLGYVLSEGNQLKLISRRTEAHELESCANYTAEQSISFDFARYEVAENNFAFGIRRNSQYKSRGENGACRSSGEENLNLYLPVGGVLNLIFMTKTAENSGSGDDCSYFFYTNSIIVLKQANHAGFFDIIKKTTSKAVYADDLVKKSRNCVTDYYWNGQTYSSEREADCHLDIREIANTNPTDNKAMERTSKLGAH